MKAQNAIEDARIFRDINRYKYDQSFFNPAFTMTPLSFSYIDRYRIRSVKLPGGISDYYQDRASRLSLLEGGEFGESFFLFDNGVVAYHVAIDISAELTTDDVIFLTNILIKHNPTIRIQSLLTSADVNEIRPLDRIGQVCNIITSGCKSLPRTTGTDTYSLIMLHRLGDNIEHALDGDSSLRPFLYHVYENEFHALSVRTIEEWQKRYPKGTHFEEKNESLSPVGILRINFRNTLMYEYPYSKDVITKLHYPAIIELRAWSFILGIFISEVQIYMDQISNIPITLTPVSEIETKRKAILNALDDFNGYAMSTARRTRNFYEKSIGLFEIDKITELLLAKLAALQEIVAQQRQNEDSQHQRLMQRLQTQLLDSIQGLLQSQQASSVALSIINILLGGTLAFYLAGTLSISPFYAMLIFFSLVILFYLIGKRSERLQFIESIISDVQFRISGSFDVNALMRAMSKQRKIVDWEVVNIRLEGGAFLWQQRRKRKLWLIGTLLGREQTEVVLVSLSTNLLLSLGKESRYTDIYVRIGSNYDVTVNVTPQELSTDILIQTINNLSDNAKRRGDSAFFTSFSRSDDRITREDIISVQVQEIVRR